MDTPPRSGSGAPVAQCADEDACTVVSCAVCLKEIPADAARLNDAQDYVHHFCGLDCLEAWRKQAASRDR
ncbi:MAG: DUF3330 domain-containing protein [Thiobacillus sp.]|nr:DUF3330 domain-containing protein [Thiobacillus sp.]